MPRIRSEIGRGDNLLGFSETVLANGKPETARLKGGLTFGTSLHPYDGYGQRQNEAWRRGQRDGGPAGYGSVLDPFAGGSVRGIVAAMLGRGYLGVDLREEQCQANEAQAREILGGAGPRLAAPRVEEHGQLRVVRDDETPGGTKVRALLRVLGSSPAGELVYAGPAEGFAQLAVAVAARELGKRAVLFVAKRKERSARTCAAAAAGAEIREVAHGYLSNVQAKGRAYCKAHSSALLVPFGLDAPEYLEALAEVARSAVAEPPAEVWCVAGSGVMARALALAWPAARLRVVTLGREPKLPAGAERFEAPERFEQDAAEPPPWPSCGNYDAKAWRFLRAHASPGALFWNVAADRPAAPEPRWLVGDSRESERGSSHWTFQPERPALRAARRRSSFASCMGGDVIGGRRGIATWGLSRGRRQRGRGKRPEWGRSAGAGRRG